MPVPEKLAYRLVAAFLATGIVCAASAPAEEKPVTGGQSVEKGKKPMKPDQPMSGEMKRETMLKGDVKKAAEKKQLEMKDAIGKEEKAMPMSEIRK